MIPKAFLYSKNEFKNSIFYFHENINYLHSIHITKIPTMNFLYYPEEILTIKRSRSCNHI